MQQEQLGGLFASTQRIELNTHNMIAFNCWSLMGQVLDWSAMDPVLEYLEASDVDLVIQSIITLKGFADQMRTANNG